jgi:hypothetical protein
MVKPKVGDGSSFENYRGFKSLVGSTPTPSVFYNYIFRMGKPIGDGSCLEYSRGVKSLGGSTPSPSVLIIRLYRIMAITILSYGINAGSIPAIAINIFDNLIFLKFLEGNDD